MALITRRADLAPSSYDAEAQTIEATISTGAPVRRRDSRGNFIERLDLSTVNPESLIGLPVLDGHRQSGARDVVGVVVSARHENGSLVAVIQLSSAEDVRSTVQKIVEGTIRATSIGYSIASQSESFENGERVKTVVPRILEVSLVAIPADPGATIRSREMDDDVIDDNVTMPEQQQQQIRAIGELADLPPSFAEEQIRNNATIEEARAAARQALIARTQQTPRIRVVSPPSEDPDARLRNMEEALHARVSGVAPPEQARPFVGHTLRDFARECLTMRGISTAGMDVDQLFRAAMHTTSDFPNLLTGTGRRTLLASYTAAASPLTGC